MTIAIFNKNINRLANETVKEFEANFNNPLYWNTVPTYTGV